MSLSLDGETLTVYVSWSELKVLANNKMMSLQYVRTSNDVYQIFGLDSRVLYRTNIYSGSYPNFIDADAGDPPTSVDNDSCLYDFETNFKSSMNLSITPYMTGDPRWVYRLGNQANTSVTESLVYGRIYREPPSEAQRSVVSTSANDIWPNGSGAKKVRIVYLNSNYIKKIEDISLSGTNAVNTVGTDIRFIDDFYVIAGTAAVGAVRLMSSTNGGGSEVCGIGSGADSAYMCHHYIPSGSQVQMVKWGTTASDDVQMRLKGQRWTSGSLVDIVLDLDMMTGITSGSRLDFERTLVYAPLPEKTYIRVTAQPGQSTSTTVRSRMELWEDVLYVSGTT